MPSTDGQPPRVDYNKHLAPSYSEQAIEQGPLLLDNIHKQIIRAIAVHDERLLSLGIRKCTTYLSLKYSITPQQRVDLARVLTDYALARTGTVPTRKKAAKLAGQLLKKHRAIARETQTTFDWRPLYDAYVIDIFHENREWTYVGEDEFAGYRSQLTRLVRRWRRFFDPEAASAIVSKIEPLFSLDDDIVFRGAGLLSLFYPVTQATPETIPHFFQYFERIDQCHEWDLLWLTLFARIAKATQGRLDWTPHVDRVFTHLLRVLSVSLGNFGSQAGVQARTMPRDTRFLMGQHSPSAHQASMRGLSKLMVYLVGSTAGAEERVISLFNGISHYYHPLNSGSWSSRLAQLLLSFSSRLSKRIGQERRQESPAPSESYLPEDCARRLVLILQPIVFQAQYSKHMNMARFGDYAFKALATIDPKGMLPSFFQDIVPALQTVDKTHQTLSGLSTLGVCIRQVLDRGDPESLGPHYLSQLLTLTLPGLDPNDMMKTAATLKFYINFLSIVPLVDCSSAPSKAVSEVDMAARNATGVLEDWAMQVIDRLTRVFLQLDKPSKNSPQGFLTGMSSTMYKLFGDLFFSQLTPQLHKRIANKLVDFVMENPHIEGGSVIGQLCSSATLAAPEIFVGALMPRIQRALLEGDAISDTVSDRNLQWNLILLGGAVRRAGASLLPYVSFLETLISFALSHENGKINKHGGKLLRRLLQGLGDIYPTEYRTVGPKTWQSEEYQQAHYMHWTAGHKEVSEDDFEMTWHEPNAEEKGHVVRLCEKYASQAQSLISSAMNSMDTDQPESKRSLLQALVAIRAILRSTPPAELPETSDSSDPAYDSPKLVLPEGCTQGGSSDLRASLGTSLAELLTWLQDNRPDDVKSTRKTIKIISLFMVNRGGLRTSKSGSKSTQLYSSFKFIVTDLVVGSRARPRWLVIERLRHLHEVRVGQRSWLPPQSLPIYGQLQDLLMKSAVSTYSKVRSIAQGAVQQCFVHFPKHSRQVLPNFIQAHLGQSNDSLDHQVTGAIYTLTNNHILRVIARDAELLAMVLTTLMKASSHSKPTVATRANELFSSFTRIVHPIVISAYPSSSLAVPDSLASYLPSSEDISQAESRKSERNTKGQTTLSSLAQSLVEDARSDGGWKNAVNVTACLLFIGATILSQSESVLDWLGSNLTNEVAPVRAAAREALSILAIVGRGGLYVTDEYTAWLSSVHTSGHGMDIDNSGALAPLKNAIASCLKKQEPSFPRFWSSMVADHREEGEGRTEQASHIFKSRPFLHSLQMRSSWPTNRWVDHHNAFQPDNALFLENLVVVTGDSAWIQGIIGSQVTDLVKDMASKASQCCAAEIVAGVLVGSALSNDDALQREAQQWFMTWYNETSSGQAASEWISCIRHVINSVPTDRITWLTDLAFAPLSAGDSSTALAKKLRVSRAIMKHVGSSRASDAAAFLSQLEEAGFMHHALKQVRTEVSYTLSVISSTAVQADGSFHPSFKTWIQGWAAKVQADIDADSPEGEGRQRADIAMHWLIGSFSHAELPSLAQTVPLFLSVPFAYVDDNDKDVSNIAKTVLRYISNANIGINGILAVGQNLIHVATSENWHVRQAVLPVLQELTFRGMFLDSQTLRVPALETVIKLLEDPQIEVRLLARDTLASLVRGLGLYRDEEERTAVVTKFSKRGRVKVNDTSAADRINRRHSGVLGLESLLLANAFEVPAWLVDIVMELCGHTRDPSPIRDSVKKTLAEFWRTHADTWSKYEHLFQPDDLERLMDLVSAPSSYFS